MSNHGNHCFRSGEAHTGRAAEYDRAGGPARNACTRKRSIGWGRGVTGSADNRAEINRESWLPVGNRLWVSSLTLQLVRVDPTCEEAIHVHILVS